MTFKASKAISNGAKASVTAVTKSNTTVVSNAAKVANTAAKVTSTASKAVLNNSKNTSAVCFNLAKTAVIGINIGAASNATTSKTSANKSTTNTAVKNAGNNNPNNLSKNNSNKRTKITLSSFVEKTIDVISKVVSEVSKKAGVPENKNPKLTKGTNSSSSKLIPDSFKNLMNQMKDLFDEVKDKNSQNNSNNTLGDTHNNTSLYRTNQYNGNQFNYNFTSEFNESLDESVSNLLDNVIDGKFTDEEKEYLQKVIPYIVKGVGASESGWSDGSEGFVGLTIDGLNSNTNTYLEYTFKDTNYSTDISDYSKPSDGAEISAAMLIHWVDYYKNNKGYDINTALWNGQVSYCGGSSNAAYQLGMANDFYKQDFEQPLFDGHCAKVVNNLSNYGVYNATEDTQVSSVTVYVDKVNVVKI